MDVDEAVASPRGVKRKADDVPLTVTAPRRIKVRTSMYAISTSNMHKET
jgi:hypothetical protein